MYIYMFLSYGENGPKWSKYIKILRYSSQITSFRIFHTCRKKTLECFVLRFSGYIIQSLIFWAICTKKNQKKPECFGHFEGISLTINTTMEGVTSLQSWDASAAASSPRFPSQGRKALPVNGS